MSGVGRGRTWETAVLVRPHPDLDVAEPLARVETAADHLLDLGELQVRDHRRVARPPDDERPRSELEGLGETVLQAGVDQQDVQDPTRRGEWGRVVARTVDGRERQ